LKIAANNTRALSKEIMEESDQHQLQAAAELHVIQGLHMHTLNI
jgi:hypothetical protein